MRDGHEACGKQTSWLALVRGMSAPDGYEQIANGRIWNAGPTIPGKRAVTASLLIITSSSTGCSPADAASSCSDDPSLVPHCPLQVVVTKLCPSPRSRIAPQP